jgi:hypothetical protein
MSAFFRIKNYIINLEALAYVQIENNFIAFGFTFHSETLEGQNYIRLEKGTHLQDAEFEQVKEFVLQLPELDRVIVI